MKRCPAYVFKIVLCIFLFNPPAYANSLTITADQSGLFFSFGEINGKKTIFLIDTGATHLTLNYAQAIRLGLDYKNKGFRVQTDTAAGQVHAWAMRLDEVKLGDQGEINLKGVPAIIMDNDYPQTILLGMSFLNRTEISIKKDEMKIKETSTTSKTTESQVSQDKTSADPL